MVEKDRGGKFIGTGVKIMHQSDQLLGATDRSRALCLHAHGELSDRNGGAA